jgi:hypothetical protein
MVVVSRCARDEFRGTFLLASITGFEYVECDDELTAKAGSDFDA